VAALAAAPAVYVLATASPAGALTLTVDDTADGPPVASDCTTPVPGSCSVRDAMAAAAAAGTHTIVLAAGVTYTLNYCNAVDGEALRLGGNSTVTIQGNGATLRQTCPAASDNGVIEILGAATFTLNSTTLTGGNATSGVGGLQAGNDLAVLTVNSSTITGNTATFQAGIGTAGSLTVNSSTISGNHASGSNGGAINTFDDVAQVVNSTITGNSAAVNGGGITSTIGGVHLVYSTVSGNTAPTGANIDVPGAGLTAFGSVIGNPLGGGANCVHAGTSNGYNFEEGSNTCFASTSTGDVVNGASPQLGALASNGGPTQTMLPATSSPLVDKIPASSPCAGVNITVDQRGLPRPTTAGQFCDIGAVELQQPAVLVFARFTG
jgi:hypothetical protein